MSGAAIFTGLVLKADDTAYWVAFPDFACCFSCGDTLQEAARNARDALQTHIDGLAEDGFTIPAPRPRAAILKQDAEEAVAVLDVAVDIPACAAQNNIHPLPRRPARGFKP